MPTLAGIHLPESMWRKYHHRRLSLSEEFTPVSSSFMKDLSAQRRRCCKKISQLIKAGFLLLSQVLLSDAFFLCKTTCITCHFTNASKVRVVCQIISVFSPYFIFYLTKLAWASISLAVQPIEKGIPKIVMIIEKAPYFICDLSLNRNSKMKSIC